MPLDWLLCPLIPLAWLPWLLWLPDRSDVGLRSLFSVAELWSGEPLLEVFDVAEPGELLLSGVE